MHENQLASARLQLAKEGFEVIKAKAPTNVTRLPTSYRSDAWVNPNSGYGVQHSANQTAHYSSKLISPSELQSLYRDDWVAKKGVDKPADDMTRKGISFLPNDDDESTDDETEDLGDLLKNKYKNMMLAKQAIAFARLSGGSVCFFNYGGDELEQQEPIEDYQKKEIKWIRVFPSWDAIPTSWYTDFSHQKYQEPEHYQILLKGPSSGKVVTVHESRLIIMQGRLNTPIERANNRGWFDSMLQAAYQPVRDFQIASSSSSGVMEDFVYKTLGMDGLAEMVMNGQDDEILQRVFLANQKLHIGSLSLYDNASEAMEKKGTPVTGLADLWDRTGDNTCAAFDMARSIFFSNETGNLGGSSGEVDLRIYYDGIVSRQENDLRPWENEFIKNVSLVEHGKESDAAYEFNSLWEPTSKEKTEERYIQAQTDGIYLDHQVISPEETGKARFLDGEPNLVKMDIDFEERAKAQELASEEEQDEIAALNAKVEAALNVTPKENPGKVEKTDSTQTPQVTEVKHEIKIEQPEIKIVMPKQKDNSEELKAVQLRLDDVMAKLDEDVEVKLED